MVTVGGVVAAPAPVPVTIAEMVPPPAVKVRFVLTVVVVVGVNRTVTAWVAPAPLRVNGLPDAILKGAATDADPETVPPPVLDKEKVCSAKLPRFTQPKFTVLVGLTTIAAREMALAMLEQEL